MYVRTPALSCAVAVLMAVAFRVVAADLAVDLIPDRTMVRPGDSLVLAVHCRVPRGYHLYGNPLGPGIGKPLMLEVADGEGVSWCSARKTPARKYQPDADEWVWAYSREATFFIVGIVDPSASGTVRGTVSLEALICRTACVTVEKQLSFSLRVATGNEPVERFNGRADLADRYAAAEELAFDPATRSTVGPASGDENVTDDLSIGDSDEIPEWDYDPVEERSELRVAVAVLLALLAGIILNVMPCVLPVLGIKIMSLSEGKSGTRREAVVRSLVFAAGMLLIFMVLATLAALAEFSWGQQFQSPPVLVGIVCVIFAFSLGMFDVYALLVPPNVASLGQKGGPGLAGDFVKGMFTTILATPCSGPFLGATLAWTLSQSRLVIYAVFFAIGVGMALPYVILSASKRLARLVPKPGAWMEDLKHVMGFVLMGFAAYLLVGLPSDMVPCTVGLCVVIACALFAYRRIAPFGAAAGRRAAGWLVLLALCAGGWYVAFPVWNGALTGKRGNSGEGTELAWRAFSPALLTEAHMRGQNVLVDFTASWCLNCQYNKHAVLHSTQVADLVSSRDILALKADLTGHSPAAESLMRYLGSRSVPFFAVFPGDNPYSPIIMRDVLTRGKVVAALKALPER